MRDIERYVEEGKEYLKAGDAVQASEKLYKAAEEKVKALAQFYADGVWEEAEENGRWTSPLLFKAVAQIAQTLGGEIKNYPLRITHYASLICHFVPEYLVWCLEFN